MVASCKDLESEESSYNEQLIEEEKDNNCEKNIKKNVFNGIGDFKKIKYQ